MCIGVPMRIEHGDGVAAVAIEQSADGSERRHTLDMMIVGEQPPGAWVLVFAGAARRVLEPLEARQIRDALAALAVAVDADASSAQSGIDALFADLVERTPELPAHLRTQ